MSCKFSFLPNKRGTISLGIPEGMRFPLLFTIFFAILGIAIKSIYVNHLVLYDFFIKDYIIWIKSFGSFWGITQLEQLEIIIVPILKSWYYLFYSLGLLMLMWSILSWVINFQINIKKNTEMPVQRQEARDSKQVPDLKSLIEEQKEADNAKMDFILEKGRLALASGKVSKATEIYNDLRKMYKPGRDNDKIYYKKINSFYSQLIGMNKK